MLVLAWYNHIDDVCMYAWVWLHASCCTYFQFFICCEIFLSYWLTPFQRWVCQIILVSNILKMDLIKHVCWTWHAHINCNVCLDLWHGASTSVFDSRHYCYLVQHTPVVSSNWWWCWNLFLRASIWHNFENIDMRKLLYDILNLDGVGLYGYELPYDLW